MTMNDNLGKMFKKSSLKYSKPAYCIESVASIEKSYSSEADSHSSRQEPPLFCETPKFIVVVTKSANGLHCKLPEPNSHPIHFNIILSFTPVPPK